MSLYRDLNFYQTDEYFYLVPVTPKSGGYNEPLATPVPAEKALLINRRSEQISLSSDAAREVLNWYPSKRVHGILGVIQLIAGKYLLLISRVVKCAELLSEPLYRVESIEMVPYHQSDLHLTEQQRHYNTQYLQMLTTFFSAGPFFYLSYQYDLSHTLQARYQMQKQASLAGTSLYQRSDKRYVWNHYLMGDLLRTENLELVTGFCIPVIYGFVAQHRIESMANAKPFTYTLISRRCATGSGTRYFRRGAQSQDAPGAVTNLVETEQILSYAKEGQVASSYVQLRGSVPLYWSQYPDLRYKPPPTIEGPDRAQQQAFLDHLRSILPPYESLVMINLINHTGSEQILLQKFRQIHRDTSELLLPKKVLLESFDFHHECRNNRWDRLSILLDSLAHHIEKFGYFSTTERDTYQRGCFRTNCVDSLDRTNVVQGLLAKCSLEQQLTHFGVIAPGQKVEDFPEFWNIFRNVWADNADACSIQYAGTPALKTDFTRTGKRRLYGKMQDGLNSCIRYYKNNFEDGFRQDSFDLLLGRHFVTLDEGKTAPCPLANRNMLKIVSFPLFLLVSFSLLFFALLFPTEQWTDKWFNLLLWFSFSGIVTLLMFRSGKQFVDFPTLVPLPPLPPSVSSDNENDGPNKNKLQ